MADSFEIDPNVNDLLRLIPDKNLQEKFLNAFGEAMSEVQKKDPTIPGIGQISAMLTNPADSGWGIGCIAGILRFHPRQVLSSPQSAADFIKLMNSLKDKKEYRSFATESLGRWKKKIIAKFGDLEEGEKRAYFNLIKII